MATQSKANPKGKSKVKSKAKSRAKSKAKSKAKSRAKSKQKSRAASPMKSKVGTVKKKGTLKKGPAAAAAAGSGPLLEARVYNFMSLPFTGYFRDGNRRIDLVIIIRDDHVTRSEKVKLLYFEQLCKLGLQLELEQGLMPEHNHLLFIKVHAPERFIVVHGEYFMYFKLFKDIRSEALAPSATARLTPFASALSDKGFVTLMRDNYPGPAGYSTLDRSRIVMDTLSTTRLGGIYGHNPLARMVKLNLVTDVFALHDGPFFLVDHQETDKINARQVAMFFAFYGFYNYALTLPALAGVAGAVFDALHGGDSNVTYITLNKFVCPNCKFFDVCPYAMLVDSCTESRVNDALHTVTKQFVLPLVMFVWAAGFLKLWQRRENYCFWAWEVDQEYMADVMRIHEKGFQFHKRQAPLLRLLRLLLQCALAALLVAYGCYNVYLLLYWRYGIHRHLPAQDMDDREQYKINYYILSFLAVSNCGIVFLLERMFGMVIFYMPVWEALRTPLEGDRAVAYRLFAVSFVCTFNFPIFIAFFKGQFYTTPIDMELWRRRGGVLMEKCDPRACLDQLLVVLLALVYTRELVLKFIPYFKLFGPMSDYSDLGMLRSARTPHWEREKLMKSSMETEKFLTFKYRDLVIQFASVTMFAGIFPLGPIIALLTNAIDIRVCARRLVLFSRRPLLRRHAGATPWRPALLTALLATALCHILTMTFSSENVAKYARLSGNVSVVDHVDFMPLRAPRIYSYTPARGRVNASLDDSLHLDYIVLKAFPEWDYIVTEEFGSDSPVHEYMKHIENSYGESRASCSCTTAKYSEVSVRSTNDYELSARRVCHFRGYWRRYTGVLPKGRYVGLTTNRMEFFTFISRLGRGVGNFSGSVMSFFGLGFASGIVTGPTNWVFSWKNYYQNAFRRYMDVYWLHGYARTWQHHALRNLQWLLAVLLAVLYLVIFACVYWVPPAQGWSLSEAAAVELHVRRAAAGGAGRKEEAGTEGGDKAQ